MFPPLGVPLNPERCINLQELCVFPCGFFLKPTRKVYIPAKKTHAQINKSLYTGSQAGFCCRQKESTGSAQKGVLNKKTRKRPLIRWMRITARLGVRKTQARIQQPRGDLQGKDLDHEAHVSPPPPSGISELDLKFVQIRRKRPLNPCSDRDHGVVSLFCVCVKMGGRSKQLPFVPVFLEPKAVSHTHNAHLSFPQGKIHSGNHCS